MLADPGADRSQNQFDHQRGPNMTLTLQLINFMFYMQNLERKSLIYVTRTCMHIVYCLSLSPLLLDLDRHLDGQAQINVNALCKVQWHHALFALFFANVP